MNKERYSLKNEKKWQDYWEKENIFKYIFQPKNTVYSIDTPPPTISWDIHIGHIFSYTQAEIIARHKRKIWDTIFYPFWFDDNWLPTERLVEKEIWAKWSGMPREQFNKECLKITSEYRNKFKKLWKYMGLSVDWDLSYSTISPNVQKISQTSFLNLIRKWLIYKKDAPALWCTECQTAVAQAEVEKKEFASVFYDIEFDLLDWWNVIISTTRPELLPACLAVFINPKDTRYKNILWKEVITPLWNKVKILEDDKVEKEKWTWIVMCCSYGDETDMYWTKKYSLKEKIILDKKWKLINVDDEDLKWVYYKKARKIIVEKLKSINKITWKKNIIHDVWTHERCSTPIDIITVKQWFVKILDIKEKLIELWDKIDWYPNYMKKRYIEWVENLKWDWCISRERFFGIPIPVWYSKISWEIILPEEKQLPINPLKDTPNKLPKWHTKDNIIPDKDVLDTWATSALTPLINSNFFDDENSHKILPMNLRPQAHDIIRTWALYTIVMSYYHTWDIPFKNIMISWHVLAMKWEKISKSKGNTKTAPENLIEKYWADAVRYWTCWWNLWKDIVFDEQEIKKWQKLVTKLWNVIKFIEKNLWDFDFKNILDSNNLELIDKWIIFKSIQTWENMKKYFEKFQVWHALKEFESFFWSDFCDNYLEIVKDKINNSDSYKNWENMKKSSEYWLYFTSLNIINLISPILPHITEELYQRYFRSFEKETSIHKKLYSIWLKQNEKNNYKILTEEVKQLFNLITLIRKYKTDNKIKYWLESKEINVYWNIKEIENYKKYFNDIKSITRTWKVNFYESYNSKVDIIF